MEVDFQVFNSSDSTKITWFSPKFSKVAYLPSKAPVNRSKIGRSCREAALKCSLHCLLSALNNKQSSLRLHFRCSSCNKPWNHHHFSPSPPALPLYRCLSSDESHFGENFLTSGVLIFCNHFAPRRSPCATLHWIDIYFAREAFALAGAKRNVTISLASGHL